MIDDLFQDGKFIGGQFTLPKDQPDEINHDVRVIASEYERDGYIAVQFDWPHLPDGPHIHMGLSKKDLVSLSDLFKKLAETL